MRRLIALSAAASLLVFAWVALAGDVSAPPPPQGPPGDTEWTDTGTVLHPQETGDDVVFGATSPVSSAKLSIDGDADQIQALIQGNATQTSDVLRVENSSQVNLFTVAPTGSLTIKNEASACVDPPAGQTSLCAFAGELFQRKPGGTSRELLNTDGGDYGSFTCTTGSCLLDTGSVGSLAIVNESILTTDIGDGQITGPKLGVRQFRDYTRLNPNDADNFILFRAPYAITIMATHCIIDPADSGESVVVTVQERDSAGDNPTTVHSITADNDGAGNGTVPSPNIEAANHVGLDIGTVTGTVSQLTCTIQYTID